MTPRGWSFAAPLDPPPSAGLRHHVLAGGILCISRPRQRPARPVMDRSEGSREPLGRGNSRCADPRKALRPATSAMSLANDQTCQVDPPQARSQPNWNRTGFGPATVPVLLRRLQGRKPARRAKTSPQQRHACGWENRPTPHSPGTHHHRPAAFPPRHDARKLSAPPRTDGHRLGPTGTLLARTLQARPSQRRVVTTVDACLPDGFA